MDWKSSFKFNFSFRNSSFKSKSDKLSSDDERDAGGTSLPTSVTREVLPTEVIPNKLVPETITLHRGLTLLKGRVPSSELSHLGCSHSDLVPGKYEGGLKLWECTIDLIETLRQEIQDGRLSFRGKDVLELGCGHGLPGILACIKGSRSVHFQDFNVDVLRALTIPNVETNIEHGKIQAPRPSDGLVRQMPTRKPDVRYFAGDWSEVGRLLSGSGGAEESSVAAAVGLDEGAVPKATGGDDTVPSSGQEASNTDISEENECDEQGSEKGEGITEGTREAGAGGCDGDSTCGKDGGSCSSSGGEEMRGTVTTKSDGYDIILMSETVYSPASLPKLYALIKTCLRLPYGVVYVAGKKYYFGVGGGVRQFRTLVEEDGLLTGHLLAEFVDGMSNVREIWKFFRQR